MTEVLDISVVDIERRLFSLGDFGFITEANGLKHEKQEQALRLLTDNTTRELGYGGAAGGAKSWTGCVWLAFMCLIFPGTRWFIGREELKRLRDSTLITFYKVAKAYGLQREDWTYHGSDHAIKFANDSRIDLLDLKYLPSDPLYERYGSMEYTGGWIEEAGEVHFDAFDTLKSRIGRHMNDQYGLLPKIYVTFNPKKNFVYTYFYKPWKDGKIPADRVFLPALLYDNPHRESSYEGQLLGMSKGKKERLLKGNFEYDDDPSVLCDYDAICDLFTNEHVKPTGIVYGAADLAMQGRDRFIAVPRDGYVVDFTKGFDKELATGKSIETDLKLMMVKCGISRSRTAADSDGMGAYLESYLEGIYTFHNGARANDPAEFANLKSECAYKLAEKVNRREMRIICSEQQQERIKEELSVLKADDVDNDTGKKKIITKDEMKELIGHSPDYLDVLIMLMVFDVKPKAQNFY